MGAPGKRTATEVYEKKLESLDMLIQGDHYHWKGSQPTMFAIHDSSYEFEPLRFTRRQIRGLKAYGKAATKNMTAAGSMSST